MKLIGLMVVRNEEWVLNLSLRAALKWCDHVVVLDHASVDATPAIIQTVASEFPGRITTLRRDDGDWREMEHRQQTLDVGRALGGTHFAIVDADEVLTSPFLERVRPALERLPPRCVLEVWMCPLWRSIDAYRIDHADWSFSWLTVGFADDPVMHWSVASDGYDHHSRTPYGCKGRQRLEGFKAYGGCFHLQWVNWHRVLAKHIWYRLVEHLRWPGREPLDDLNAKYNRALDERNLMLKRVPSLWWSAYADLTDAVDPRAVPWHEGEIRRLIAEHGIGTFDGLQLGPYEFLRRQAAEGT